MSPDSQSQHFQSQAVTILAIATVALGFGLFGAEFRASVELLPVAKCVSGGYALVFYAALVISVRRILESSHVSGRDVTQGPLTHMAVVMVYVASIFVLGLFENPDVNQSPA